MNGWRDDPRSVILDPPLRISDGRYTEFGSYVPHYFRKVFTTIDGSGSLAKASSVWTLEFHPDNTVTAGDGWEAVCDGDLVLGIRPAGEWQ